ncbi:MAG: aminopeptidase P family protein [Candidatus Omnitrophica bacterium]|nr:aminopeptidase P family protein [Candidatus Omnitrophota bacterium]
MKNTQNKLKKIITKAEIDCLVLSKNTDIFYHTGYRADNDFLLCLANGKKYFLTSPLTEQMAKKSVSHLDIEVVSGNAGMNFKKIIKDNNLKKIGCDIFSLSTANSRLIKPSTIIDISGDLASLRLVKQPDEIIKIKKAAKLTKKIWTDMQKIFNEPFSEIEIARLFDIEIRRVSEGNSFPTICASGPNSANPHAVPTKRSFKNNDLLLVDFGIKIDGYCSDLTRIKAKGRINRTLDEMLLHVSKSQEKTLNIIMPGVQVKTLSLAAYGYLKKAGFGKYILHSLGHGIGLDVHESPGVHEKSSVILKEGMIITIEPGLYVKGLGGVRIEDMVLVTKKGCEVLTK